MSKCCRDTQIYLDISGALLGAYLGYVVFRPNVHNVETTQANIPATNFRSLLASLWKIPTGTELATIPGTTSATTPANIPVTNLRSFRASLWGNSAGTEPNVSLENMQLTVTSPTTDMNVRQIPQDIFVPMFFPSIQSVLFYGTWSFGPEFVSVTYNGVAIIMGTYLGMWMWDLVRVGIFGGIARNVLRNNWGRGTRLGTRANPQVSRPVGNLRFGTRRGGISLGGEESVGNDVDKLEKINEKNYRDSQNELNKAANSNEPVEEIKFKYKTDSKQEALRKQSAEDARKFKEISKELKKAKKGARSENLPGIRTFGEEVLISEEGGTSETVKELVEKIVKKLGDKTNVVIIPITMQNKSSSESSQEIRITNRGSGTFSRPRPINNPVRNPVREVTKEEMEIANRDQNISKKFWAKRLKNVKQNIPKDVAEKVKETVEGLGSRLLVPNTEVVEITNTNVDNDRASLILYELENALETLTSMRRIRAALDMHEQSWVRFEIGYLGDTTTFAGRLNNLIGEDYIMENEMLGNNFTVYTGFDRVLANRQFFMTRILFAYLVLAIFGLDTNSSRSVCEKIVQWIKKNRDRIISFLWENEGSRSVFIPFVPINPEDVFVSILHVQSDFGRSLGRRDSQNIAEIGGISRWNRSIAAFFQKDYTPGNQDPSLNSGTIYDGLSDLTLSNRNIDASNTLFALASIRQIFDGAQPFSPDDVNPHAIGYEALSENYMRIITEMDILYGQIRGVESASNIGATYGYAMNNLQNLREIPRTIFSRSMANPNDVYSILSEFLEKLQRD